MTATPLTLPVIHTSRGVKHRISSDNVWPLRRANGQTFARSKEKQPMSTDHKIGD